MLKAFDVPTRLLQVNAITRQVMLPHKGIDQRPPHKDALADQRASTMINLLYNFRTL